MSDEDQDRPLIRNEDTLRRRAWIDQALASVKGRLRPAELGEGAVAADPPGRPPDPAPGPRRPRLYLVKGPGESG